MTLSLDGIYVAAGDRSSLYKLRKSEPPTIVDQLLELRTVIEGYQLKRGLGSDLSRYLNLAIKYIGRGRTAHACQQLDQFLATVERTASKTPPWLSSSEATTLAEGGRRIRAVLGC